MGVEERLARLEAEIRDLRDRAEIQDVLFRYCRAADRCDLELMRSCYHPDATDTHRFYSGPAAGLVRVAQGALEEIAGSVHAITNVLIDLDGDRAFSESQVTIIHRVPDGADLVDLHHSARYLDVFERREGRWRILHRQVVYDGDRWWRVPSLDVSAAMSAGAANASTRTTADLTVGRRDRDDAVYLGHRLGEVPVATGERDHLWDELIARIRDAEARTHDTPTPAQPHRRTERTDA